MASFSGNINVLPTNRSGCVLNECVGASSPLFQLGFEATKMKGDC